MATFSRASTNGGTAFKFYIRNETNGRSISYDFTPLTKVRFTKTISGNSIGTIASKTSSSFNFDATCKTLEEGNISILNVAGLEIPFRFWSSSSPVDPDQYINLNAVNGFTVTQDTSEISEIRGNGIRVTVDAGGKKQTTLDIYVQVYSA